MLAQWQLQVWWSDPLLREQLKLVLATCLAVGTACSLLSVLAVLKRLAFIGQGISHAGFGGVGSAVFLGLTGWRQDLAILAFCAASALLLGAMVRRGRVEADSAIGIVLVAAMAWGVFIDDAGKAMLAAQTPWYLELVGQDVDRRTSFERLLFGEVFLVDQARAGLACALATAALAAGAAFFKEILFWAFDEEHCAVFGTPRTLIQNLVLLLLAVTIVISIRLAGFVLVSALLIIPGAAALLLSRRLAWVLGLAWLIGLTGVLGGLLLSLELKTFSTGPCIVGVLCAWFALAFTWHAAARRLRPTPPAPTKR